MADRANFELKGWHVLLGLLGAFAVIIIANATLAINAVKSFPGMSVENSYVASQEFDKKKAAQAALGWESEVDYEAGIMRIALHDEDGQFIQVPNLRVMIGRPATDQLDHELAVLIKGDLYQAPIALEAGNWLVIIQAKSEDGTEFEQRHKLYIGE